MLTRSPLEIEMFADVQSAELERKLRSRRPEWYGDAIPFEGSSLRRGLGRLLISTGTWLSGTDRA
jgi:hypothetical protein